MGLPGLPWRRLQLSGTSTLLALAVAVFYAGPLLSLVVSALRDVAPGQPGTWTLQAWSSVWHDPQLRQAVSNALWLATTTVTLAATLSILAVRSDLPGRALLTPAMVLMFSLPTLFYAMGYQLLANPYTG